VLERLKGLDAELMEGFDAKETEVLRELLERMRDNILPSEKEKNTEI
jgi:DNA-binding MarR family transcriptional regulator